ncbi:Multidrug resistance protein MdtB [Thalassocella blandensis]|nr:Multidrug resistance protein MdtB [Thalassocella blandensis]
MNKPAVNIGISGRIARYFQATEITPLLALIGFLLGVLAMLITPQEEEPQIKVTFANVFIAYPGASAKEVEMTVTTPAEQIAAEIEGVKHIYSVSSPGLSVLTVRFDVGRERNDAIVKLYNAFYSNQDIWPTALGVSQPLIKPMGIDDVPIVALTLWSENPEFSGDALLRVAHTLETMLNRIDGTRNVAVKGGVERVLHVEVDPVRLSGFNLSLAEIREPLTSANVSLPAGTQIQNNIAVELQSGSFLSTPEDVSNLVVGVFNRKPVYLRDIARVRYKNDRPAQYHSFGVGAGSGESFNKLPGQYPAVTISIAKKPGENAVHVAESIMQQIRDSRGLYIPDDVNVTVTRNYGKTAKDKAQTLIKKLLFATVSVILLVLLTLGYREALVVGSAVVVTLAVTLFASWAWGFTLNRVSLFALIFSIGILVDDAIVVVENIHRHLKMGNKTLAEVIPIAVDEVGGPTILATFTVVAALLPMAFVSGLMGPYMLPIPINASTGMLISLAVAFIFTPWLYRKLFQRQNLPSFSSMSQTANTKTNAISEKNSILVNSHDTKNDSKIEQVSQRFFSQLMAPLLSDAKGVRNRWLLLFVLILLIAASVTLVVSKNVILKMLPFDNKSEFQVVVDLPEGTPLENTYHVLQQMAEYIATLPEVTHYQIYAGGTAPMNFNGLVRQYYLRHAPHQGDIQVNLKDKNHRHRQSHEIALSAREALSAIAHKHQATIKIVEVPPGPPVLAPLVAEVYGIDYDAQKASAKKLEMVFRSAQDVVDVDTSVEFPQQKTHARVDRARAAYLGVSQSVIAKTVQLAFAGDDVTHLHREDVKYPVPVRLELREELQSSREVLKNLSVRSNSGALLPLSEVMQIHSDQQSQSIYHKDLMPIVYVTGDVAGKTDSPLYGLLDIRSALAKSSFTLAEFFNQIPSNPFESSLKWDGEWQVTFDTFRDMGAAYAVGLILIYLLVVAQFRSYGLPLIIMAPIPLTLIGILPGHALLGQQFTAPSMIGMIALAGIIVRNSILLVDFIQQQVAAGLHLQQATVRAASVRAKPILLTAVAAMMGGFFILDDPIFGGLAVSLIFGLMVSTLLTLLVIPVVYYHYFRKN